MRVGLVCPHANPGEPWLASVPETHEHVTQVATELSVRGHDVRLYEPEGRDSRGTFTVERVPVEAPTAAVSRLTSHVATFGRWLADRWTREWRPDVVHGHFWVGGLAAATAVRSTSIPVVQTFHSLAAEQRRHLGSAYKGPGERATLERALGRAVDQAVASSGDEADELTRMGLPRANVTVVPPGVDTGLFQPEGDAQPRAGRPRILAVGLDAGHGQDDVIRALRLVADAELVIVGHGARHAEARRLRELAAHTGVGDRVHIVDDVAEQELPTWYRSADVVACAPAHSGTTRVALEAMACAVPVVGYAVGPTAECVVDKVTGRLVAPGDVRELGNGLRRLTTDGTERFAYANAAVDRVRVRYTWERTAAGLERVYERAVDNRRAA